MQPPSEQAIESLVLKAVPNCSPRVIFGIINIYKELKLHSGDQGVILLEHFIKNYNFISQNAYFDYIKDISLYLFQHYDFEKTLLCASSADNCADSGQTVLNDIRSILGINHKISKINSCTRADKAIRHIKDKKLNINTIVIVDEFVGTGQSMLGRINKINIDCDQSKIAPKVIDIIVIAGLNSALRRLSCKANKVIACVTLKHGIRDIFPIQEHSRHYLSVNNHEDNLIQVFNNEPLPKHGYGFAEALYGREFGNCPNSVFPMFWWPQDIHGNERSTPFSRVES